VKAYSKYKLNARVARTVKLLTEGCRNIIAVAILVNKILDIVQFFVLLLLKFIVQNQKKLIKSVNFTFIICPLILMIIQSLINVPSDNKIVDNNVYNNSGVLSKVFNFLFENRFYNINSREWKDLCNCRINPKIYNDIPFLKTTAYILNDIIPIAFGR